MAAAIASWVCVISVTATGVVGAVAAAGGGALVTTAVGRGGVGDSGFDPAAAGGVVFGVVGVTLALEGAGEAARARFCSSSWDETLVKVSI